MRLHEDIDFTTLSWVKPELDETLRQARLALETFAEDDADPSQVRACAAHLHQVQGTLRMVELYGAAMVAEEMEKLAKALVDGGVGQRDEALTVLMRGTVQLPDYLERLQTGQKDIPIVLLPLLNELRAARGERGLSESVLFSPDLSRPLPADVSGPHQPLASGELRRLAERQRALFQAALLRWLRDERNNSHAGALADTCDALVAITRSEHARRLFWVAAGALQALRDGMLEASKPLKQGLARVEREIKRLADAGDVAFSMDPPIDLTRQLLYFVAQAPPGHPRIDQMREVFGLAGNLPSEAELAQAQGSMSGHNRALLDTVCAAIKEDLMRVKDALDLHMRSPSNPLSALVPQMEVLDRVGDTLGMLGLGVPRRVVQEQRQAIAELIGGDRPVDEGSLLDIAGALLYVEASLDDQVAGLGRGLLEPVDGGIRGGALPGAEGQRLLDTVVKEAISNFAQARQAFVAFIETNWDHAQLESVPRLLDEVAGALRMLELTEVPDLMTAVGRFTRTELLRWRRVPDAQQIETMADAVAALEYFLEALRDHRPGREAILAHARSGLEQLGYWPLPPEAAEDQQPISAAPVQPAAEGAQEPTQVPATPAEEVPPETLVQISSESEPSTPLPSAPAETASAELARSEPPPAMPAPANVASSTPPSSAAGFEGAGDEIDDEIREVFLEEFQEEIENLSELLPAWRRDPESLDALRPIRRVFHTLKGSGRLVGALTLGEFSWRVENMLNRVLDGSRLASPAVLSLLEHACAVLPQLHAVLREGGAIPTSLEAIKTVADRLAAGEEAWLDGALLDSLQAPPPPESETAPAPPAPAPATSATPTPASLRVEVPPLDPVLLEILKAEVTGHLATIDAWLAEAGGRGCAVNDPLLRATHTINGAFAMTEVPVVTDVTSPLEGLVKRLLAQQRIADARQVQLIGDAAGAIRDVLAALASSSRELPDLAALSAALRTERDSLPEPARPTLPMQLPDESEEIVAVRLDAPDLSQLPSFGTAEVGEAAAETATAEAAAAEAAVAEAAAEAAAAEAAAAEAAAAEAAAAEAAAAEAAAAEAAAAEAAAAEAAAAEAAAAEAAAAEAAAAEAAAAEAAAAEAAAAEAAAAEAAAAEAVAAEAAAAEAAAAEAAAAEAAAAEAAAAEAAAEAAAGLAAFADDPADPDQPLDLSELDIDLLDIFVEESIDLLDHSDGLLAQLRESPGMHTLVVGLQRDLHTLKGGARMAGMHAVGDLGHAMESLLEAVSEGRVELGQADITLLEHGFDRLHQMISRLVDRRAIAMPTALIARFEQAVGLRPSTRAPSPPAPPAAEPQSRQAERKKAPAPPPAVSKPRIGALSAPIEVEAGDDDIAVRAPQEQVRIRADLLDRLVNYAGEVAIYRARLEQQLAAFRSNINEMGQTTARLREQLRKLEIETEAQIVARFQRESDAGDPTFDPLELDRFSTLQQLTRALSESAADLTSLEESLDDLTRQHETLLLQQSRVSSDLQEGLMRTRMVPFDSLVPRLRRILRQACGETGKQAQLKVVGAQGEMDRNVLDRITAPLEHMVRNSVAHGIEMPADRRAAGKPDEGNIQITVTREGSEVVIAVSDDGRGLDAAAIRAKAIERGLLRANAEVADAELYGFILQSGFSTAESVSKLAGRGVGMDVVHNEIRQLGGSLGIRSRAGKGTEFLIRLPFTLAVTQAVFIKIGETHFAVPIASVAGVGRMDRSEFELGLVRGDLNYVYAGENYPVHDLGSLIGHGPAIAEGSLQMPLLLARSGELRAAIAVDQVLGSREIVVKPVGPQVSSIPGIFGATVMGDGSVVVILDVLPLVRRHLLTHDTLVEPVAPSAAPVKRVPLVMVVDDSITMRKVSSRVLERQNYEVITAKDGIDALEKLALSVPDVMLLDIEMPRMDGYELATHMRNDPRYRGVPIIMITSRTGEKHRQRAFEIGVNRYLGKPYQEAELLRNVSELLAARGENE